MSQDESKFDTMRLIQGAETSDLYSLESIMQEFSDAPKQENPSKQEDAPKQEVQLEEPKHEESKPADEPEAPAAQPEQSEEAPQEHTEDALPIDEEQPAPAYENLSESQMADAIAQAVARSMGDGNTRVEAPAEPPAAAEPEPVIPEQPQEPVMEAPREPVQPQQPLPQPEPQPVRAEPPKQPPKPEKQKAQAATKTEKKPEPKNPGTEHQKIPKSHVSSKISAAEYIGDLVKELRRRQSMALPKPGTSLRGTEKRMSTFVQIERVLSPVRYLMILLMLLCIGGRSVGWMTLGFMKGNAAITIALIATIVSMIASWQSVVRGVRDLWYCRASYETFLLLVTILTAVEALALHNQNTFLPLIAISWAVTGTAEYLHDQASLRSLRAVITGRGRVGVRTAADKWEHTDVIGKAPVTTAGYVRHQAQPDVWHGGMGIFLPVLTFLTVIISAYLSAKTQTNYLTVLVTVLDVAMPVSLAACCARPYNLLARARAGQGSRDGLVWYAGAIRKKGHAGL